MSLRYEVGAGVLLARELHVLVFFLLLDTVGHGRWAIYLLPRLLRLSYLFLGAKKKLSLSFFSFLFDAYSKGLVMEMVQVVSVLNFIDTIIVFVTRRIPKRTDSNISI